MAKYHLDVYCYKAFPRDGGRHATDNYPDDETAIRKLKEEAQALRRLGDYDYVSCTVRAEEEKPGDDRVVTKFTIRRPVPRESSTIFVPRELLSEFRGNDH